MRKLFASGRLCPGAMCNLVATEVEDLDTKKVTITYKEKTLYLPTLNKRLLKIGGRLRELGF